MPLLSEQVVDGSSLCVKRLQKYLERPPRLLKTILDEDCMTMSLTSFIYRRRDHRERIEHGTKEFPLAMRHCTIVFVNVSVMHSQGKVLQVTQTQQNLQEREAPSWANTARVRYSMHSKRGLKDVLLRICYYESRPCRGPPQHVSQSYRH